MTDDEFVALYHKMDAETDMANDSSDVDEVVGRMIGATADEVCSRYLSLTNEEYPDYGPTDPWETSGPGLAK